MESRHAYERDTYESHSCATWLIPLSHLGHDSFVCGVWGIDLVLTETLQHGVLQCCSQHSVSEGGHWETQCNTLRCCVHCNMVCCSVAANTVCWTNTVCRKGVTETNNATQYVDSNTLRYCVDYDKLHTLFSSATPLQHTVLTATLQHGVL